MKTKVLSISFLLLLAVGFLWIQSAEAPYVFTGKKHKGMAVVAPPMKIEQSAFAEIANTNTNWVSLMPYGFVKDNQPTFYYRKEGESIDKKYQWWGEMPEGLSECIKMSHNNGMKVMLKPHMWIGWGVFTGDFVLETEEDWQVFEETYGEYMLQNARIAAKENVEMFCIGTEMAAMVKERPSFWFKLIKEIRTFYKGDLTYAENWDKIEDVPFLDKLDYIGVDAYFPLADGKNPSLTEIKAGWKPWKKQLRKLSSKYQKPILFTEVGYRSCDTATEKPWETNYDLPDNEEIQVNAYKALFDEVWGEPWFAGAHLWKWFPFEGRRGKSSDKFRFQDKPALEEIVRAYEVLD